MKPARYLPFPRIVLTALAAMAILTAATPAPFAGASSGGGTVGVSLASSALYLDAEGRAIGWITLSNPRDREATVKLEVASQSPGYAVQLDGNGFVLPARASVIASFTLSDLSGARAPGHVAFLVKDGQATVQEARFEIRDAVREGQDAAPVRVRIEPARATLDANGFASAQVVYENPGAAGVWIDAFPWKTTAGWSSTMVGHRLFVPAGGKIVESVGLQAPAGASETHARGSFTLRVATERGFLAGEATFTAASTPEEVVIVDPVQVGPLRLSFTPENTYARGAGSGVSTLLFENLGDVDVWVKAGPGAVTAGWTTSIEPHAIFLKARATHKETVKLTPPPDAREGEVGELTVEAHADHGLTAKATMRAKATARDSDERPPKYALKAQIEPSPQSVRAGGVAHYYLRITNAGRATATVDMGAWETSGRLRAWTDRSHETIGPGGQVLVSLYVSTPHDAPRGDYKIAATVKVRENGGATRETATTILHVLNDEQPSCCGTIQPHPQPEPARPAPPEARPAEPQPAHPRPAEPCCRAHFRGEVTANGYRVFLPIRGEGAFEVPLLVRGHVVDGELVLEIVVDAERHGGYAQGHPAAKADARASG